jgi:hypothetical protein
MFSHLERIAGTRAMLEICCEFIEAKMSKFHHNRAAVDPTWIQPPSPPEAKKMSIYPPFTHRWDGGYDAEVLKIRRRVMKGNGIKKLPEVVIGGEDKEPYNLRMSPLRPS